MKKSIARSIDEELSKSMVAKLRSAPEPPKKALWGWTHPSSDLGEINFQQVILSSPRLLEHAARTRSKGTWGVRHPSQSMEDYLAMISSNIPSISEDNIAKYLEQYNSVRFEQLAPTKRKYSAWLKHFIALLHTLDLADDSPHELVEHEPESSNLSEVPRKKKTKGQKKR